MQERQFTMKKIIFLLFSAFILSGCDPKLDGFYETSGSIESAPALIDARGYIFNNSTGKVHLVEQGIDVPYEVNGDKITVSGSGDILVLTILESGDLQYKALHLKKEPLSKAQKPPAPQPAEYSGK